MPIELLGNPLLESIFLNDLGAEQQNQFRNDENASKMYEAAIDHLENEIDNLDNNRDENNSLSTDIRRKCKAYEDVLALFYNNLIEAYRNLGKIEKMRARMPKLEMLCREYGLGKLATLVIEVLDALGESERGVEFCAAVCDSE